MTEVEHGAMSTLLFSTSVELDLQNVRPSVRPSPSQLFLYIEPNIYFFGYLRVIPPDVFFGFFKNPFLGLFWTLKGVFSGIFGHFCPVPRSQLEVTGMVRFEYFWVYGFLLGISPDVF